MHKGAGNSIVALFHQVSIHFFGVDPRHNRMPVEVKMKHWSEYMSDYI
jgi:hypothetical protein